jgi:hypothetical protein
MLCPDKDNAKVDGNTPNDAAPVYCRLYKVLYLAYA